MSGRTKYTRTHDDAPLERTQNRVKRFANLLRNELRSLAR